MPSLVRVWLGIGALFAALVAVRLRGFAVSPAPNVASLFPGNYRDARVAFRKFAVEAGAEIPAPLVVSEVDDLTIDLAVLRGSPSRLIVHVSGTHGAEGHAGSAIQQSILREYKAGNRTHTKDSATILFVHALNPFGFHYNRRFNENGVDLNRNLIFDAEEWAEVKARTLADTGYDKFEDLFNYHQMPTVYSVMFDLIPKIFIAMWTQGRANMQRALISGQYRDPTNYGFGGFELERSHVLLRQFINESGFVGPDVEHVVWVDVHTGLGPEAMDTILLTEGATIVTRGYHVTYHGKDSAVGKEDYKLVRGVSTNWLQMFKGSDVQHVVQEFGTIPMVLVGLGLLIDHAAYKHGNVTEHQQWCRYTRWAFFVNNGRWKNEVVRRGTHVFEDALAHLEGNKT